MSVLDPSDPSDKSDPFDPSDGIVPPHGGYRKLKTFQIAEIIYDATVIFCDRFVPRNSRTHDQMVQSARSGARNIPEGSEASATSKKTEFKLTNVAKASLEELLLDYKAFLRQRRLPIWDKNSPQARAVRRKYKSDPSDRSDSSDPSVPLDPYGIAAAPPEVAANTLLCLCNQATYLLKRQVARLDRDFLEQGGITERLYRKRAEHRRMSDKSDAFDKSDGPADRP
jgi:four helix bundle suffix protein